MTERVPTGGPAQTRMAYEAATRGSAVLRRRDRRLLAISGRDPGLMLKGILSGRIPPALRERTEGWLEGEAAYSTALTPKGKIVTDLWLIPSLEAGFLMDLPGMGLEEAEAHFRKYLNPRFATLEDRSGHLGVLTVVGPEGAEKVVVLTPMMTRGGEHSQGESPDAIRAAQERHPAITMLYAWPFEISEVAQFLAAQIERHV